MQFSLEVHNAIWQYAPKCSKSKSQGSNKPTQQLSDVGAHSLPNRSSHDENCWVLFARKISSEMPLKTSSLWTHWVWAATRCWWAEQATLPDVFGSTRGLVARLHNFNTFRHRTMTSSFRCFQRQCYLNWVTLLWSADAGELSSRCQTWSTLPQVQQEDLKQIAFDVSILRDTGNQFPISKLIFLSLSVSGSCTRTDRDPPDVALRPRILPGNSNTHVAWMLQSICIWYRTLSYQIDRQD